MKDVVIAKLALYYGRMVHGLGTSYQTPLSIRTIPQYLITDAPLKHKDVQNNNNMTP